LKRAVSTILVRYLEVDRMGVAHHSHYLAWFEVGRTDLLRSLGCTYGEMESEGVYLPVVEVSCRYRAPVRYDDLLEVETLLADVSRSRVTFEYRLRKQGEEAVLAEARTVHATINRENQVIRLPAPYRDLLARP
jgi:acyl-CoA thioester hydrolase